MFFKILRISYTLIQLNELAISLKENMNIACTICLDRFFLSSTISASPCGHLFHDKCLDRWLVDERKKTCPQCRTSITPKQVIK
jgi:hypothetical protein